VIKRIKLIREDARTGYELMDGAEFPGRNDLLTEKIIGVFYEVYNDLGFGFLESVYREAMRIALRQAGLRVEVEVSSQ
jgi:PD-(D/E)XK nuclease superfamily